MIRFAFRSRVYNCSRHLLLLKHSEFCSRVCTASSVLKWTEMFVSLLLLLCVSSCLKAQDTGSWQPSEWLFVVCVTDDNCQEQTTECFNSSCVCRPGLFTTSDGSCLSSCNLKDLLNTFIAYPDSNIRGVNNLGLSSQSSVQKCMERCVQTSGCLALDFRGIDGWCQLHNVTALTVPSQWRPKSRPNWTHYQRMCRSSVTSQPHHTYNSTCGSDSECSGINGHCFLGRCQCAAGSIFAQNQSSCRPVESCVDVQTLGGKSGVYTIVANQTSTMTVWCDMDSGDGGWLVFQRRVDGSVDFYRNWTQYEAGFGDVTGEFWLGLSKLYGLTKAQPNRLRVDLGEVNGEHHYTEYSWFGVGGPETNYTLTMSGYSGYEGQATCSYEVIPDNSVDDSYRVFEDFVGSQAECQQLCSDNSQCTVVVYQDPLCRMYYETFLTPQADGGWTYMKKLQCSSAGDCMNRQNDQSFSTYDRDNDKWSAGNCAADSHGAWWYNWYDQGAGINWFDAHNDGLWYNACVQCNLNGRYKADGAEGADGINWFDAHRDWRSFTFSEMKIKPT